MRKRMIGKKLSRASSTRKALLRSLARALVVNGKIQTTAAKAKFAQKFVEKLAAIAKENTIFSRRRVAAKMGNDRETVSLLFKIVERSKRNSGFTKIIPLTPRKGDAAEMAKIELIDWIQLPKPQDKKEKIKREEKDIKPTAGKKDRRKKTEAKVKKDSKVGKS